MHTPKSESKTTLRLTRTFTAAREKVFKAWTDPPALKKWFAPGDDYATPMRKVAWMLARRW
jgi:uncharacterized protein YndB with AHSA1/START domain